MIDFSFGFEAASGPAPFLMPPEPATATSFVFSSPHPEQANNTVMITGMSFATKRFLVIYLASDGESFFRVPPFERSAIRAWLPEMSDEHELWDPGSDLHGRSLQTFTVSLRGCIRGATEGTDSKPGMRKQKSRTILSDRGRKEGSAK
jgi:hypothetical protein